MTHDAFGGCQDSTLAEIAHKELEKILFTDNDYWLSQCPLPCRQIYYTLNTVNFHVTSITNAAFMLGMTYENFAVKKAIEKLAYDVGDLLAQVHLTSAGQEDSQDQVVPGSDPRRTGRQVRGGRRHPAGDHRIRQCPGCHRRRAADLRR